MNRNDPSGHCSLGGHWEDDSSVACQWKLSQDPTIGIAFVLEISTPFHSDNKSKVLYYNWMDNRRDKTDLVAGGVKHNALNPAIDANDGYVGTDIYSVYDGEVIFAGWDGNGFGNVVVVRHTFMGEYFYSVYAHLGTGQTNNPELGTVTGINVKVGDKVTTDTVIGTEGHTVAGGTTPNHLHFEIRKETGLDLTAGDPFLHRNYWAFADYNWKDYWLPINLAAWYPK